MRKKCVQLMTCLGVVVLLSGSAMAFSLSTNFDGVTISQTTDLTTTTGLNQWNDLVRWQVQSSGGNGGAWAQQTPNSPTTPSHETSLLFYGFDATGLGTGTPYSLQFDFINSLDSSPGVVYLGGLTGSQQISRFAPWPSLSDTDFFQAILPGGTNNWDSMSISGFIPDDYDVLYVAFQMGGAAGLRGIDNVSLDVAPVPEPSSILLLAAGMAGLLFYRRKHETG